MQSLLGLRFGTQFLLGDMAQCYPPAQGLALHSVLKVPLLHASVADEIHSKRISRRSHQVKSMPNGSSKISAGELQFESQLRLDGFQPHEYRLTQTDAEADLHEQAMVTVQVAWQKAYCCVAPVSWRKPVALLASVHRYTHAAYIITANLNLCCGSQDTDLAL